MQQYSCLTAKVMKYLIKLVVEHVSRFVRKFVPESVSYCLTLDGRSSRNEIERLHSWLSVGCELVQVLSDMSHFLQPCDQKINLNIENSVRNSVTY